MRLRLAFAAGLARAGERERARALLVGEDPALKALDLEPAAARDRDRTPAAGISELLSGIAIGLARGEDRALPLSLVQIARHAAPDNSEAHLLGACCSSGAGARPPRWRRWRGCRRGDPFAEDALDASARLLLAEKRGDEALALAQRNADRRDAERRPIMRGSATCSTSLAARPRRRRPLPARARSPSRRDAPNRWTYRLLGAAQLDKLKRWPEARAQLELGLKASPDEPLLLNYLGYNSIERGENLDAAEAMIRRALALRPDDASITNSLGWALYKRGRLPEAIETLRESEHRRSRAVRDQRASGRRFVPVGAALRSAVRVARGAGHRRGSRRAQPDRGQDRGRADRGDRRA